MAKEADRPERGRLSRFAAHPAFLLALTAALTGLLVPWITSRWEERDKAVEARRLADERELEVKASLVRQIGTTSARFLAAAETADLVNQPRALDAAYRGFQESSFDIGSQLAAYFPGSQLPKTWRDYAYSVRNAYNLLVARPERRNLWLARLSGYFEISPTVIDGLCFHARDATFAGGLRNLVREFQQREAIVVADVVGADFALRGHAARALQRLGALPPLSADKRPCTTAVRRRASDG